MSQVCGSISGTLAACFLRLSLSMAGMAGEMLFLKIFIYISYFLKFYSQ